MNEPLFDASDFSIGRVLSLSFGVLTRNLPAFLFLAVAVHVAAFLASMALIVIAAKTSPFVAVLANLFQSLATSLLTAMIAYGTYRDLRGNRASLGQVVGRGIALVIPIFFVGLLVAIIIGIGFALVFVPGIFFATILWVAIPAAVVERPGIFASLGRSSDLTKGSRWRIFGLAVVIYVPMYVVITLLTPLEQDGQLLVIVPTVLYGLLSLFAAVAAAVSYFELRRIKEGIGVGDLAAVFD